MGKNQPNSFDSSVQKANRWLKDIQKAGHLTNRIQAYTALRSVLHALRDCLPTGEVVKISAQMPLLVKGVFFDGWKAPPKPKRMSRDEFFDVIREQLRYQPGLDPSLSLQAILQALDQHLSPGELDRMSAVLPKEVKALVREALPPRKVPSLERVAEPRTYGRHSAIQPQAPL